MKLKNPQAVEDCHDILLWLFDTIIDGGAGCFYKRAECPDENIDSITKRGKGLRIGNLTSQFLAKLYLNELDHFIKQKLKARASLRYVDDLILLSDSKPQLHGWRAAIEDQLAAFRLKIHPRMANVFQTMLGMDVLAYRVFVCYRLLRNDNGHRFARRLRGFARE